MAEQPYHALSGVYEWLLHESLLTPEGEVTAFSAVVDGLAPGARVLDCAAGTGQLAVGLALRGFAVTATDASPAMMERARALALRRGAALETLVCRWAELGAQGWPARFDAVLCVGNALTHAAGPAGRRDALAGMAGVLREGGLLALTSRNWERVRAEGSGLRIGERLVERGGARALLVHRWTLAEGWDDRHELEVAVAILGADGAVASHAERLPFWPFRHETLLAELRAAGLEPASSTYSPEVERYLVTARRRSGGPGA